MHPALERLTILTEQATNKDYREDHYDMRVRMANAIPALIAALTEIEVMVADQGLIDRSDIEAIYHKHLEPLK